MAWTKSGLYITTITDLLTLVALTGGTAATAGTGPFKSLTNKIALHSNALTDGTAPINFSAASPIWANTSEVSGTGWAAGGVLFSAAAAGATSVAPTFSESPAGSIMYDMTDVSVATTTLTNARGCIMYADSLTAPAPQVDAMLVAVTFGADFSTVAGTFAITWDALGVFAMDITP
jgi:hypothetical protein